MSSDESPVPDYLMDIYGLLKCAYPEGIPETEYWPVMSLLHPIMSHWCIADVLPELTEKDHSLVYLDASGFGMDPPPSPEDAAKVKHKLDACGYEEWFKKISWWC
jgi:hypothetical protein